MNRGPTLQRLLLGAFLAATVFYVAGFALNEYLRQRHGPWEVEFTSTRDGDPQLIIRQPHLGIGAASIAFPGANPASLNDTTIRFETPRTPLPFGRVIYDDLTFLPGVVTMEVFGHEIELLPRTLYVNRRPIPWTQASHVILHPIDKPAPSPKP